MFGRNHKIAYVYFEYIKQYYKGEPSSSQDVEKLPCPGRQHVIELPKSYLRLFCGTVMRGWNKLWRKKESLEKFTNQNTDPRHFNNPDRVNLDEKIKEMEKEGYEMIYKMDQIPIEKIVDNGVIRLERKGIYDDL